MASTRILGRAYRDQLAADDRARVRRITADNHHLERRTSPGATAGGDNRKLRGIPAIGRGVTGAINGTQPLDSVSAMR